MYQFSYQKYKTAKNINNKDIILLS